MRKLHIFSFFLSIFLFCGQDAQAETSKDSLVSDDLIIRKVADGVYMHTCFLETNDFGKVPCNGMIAMHKGEAVIFDTPTTDSVSAVLIRWVQNQLECHIKAVVATHFHWDCLRGLEEFHRQGIPSYANKLTIQLARASQSPVPQYGFTGQLELKIGDENVVADFIGEGHTKDNVVGYFPAARVLFGGCLVKELGASEGNLEDATVSHWALTGIKVKAKYPDAKLIIPGHGTPGGTSLLDYTIELFKRYRDD